MLITSSNPSHLPKAPPPNTSTLRVWASTRNLRENTIQSITETAEKRPLYPHVFTLEVERNRRKLGDLSFVAWEKTDAARLTLGVDNRVGAKTGVP